MRILLTNDDGYRSEGITIFRNVLSETGYDVWVLAPRKNMSACSQAITTHRPLRLSQLDEKNCFTCDGTPADCVILALRGALGVDFDCVVSGINVGPNVGDDITFSGTVAAARQSVLMGTPAVACSLFNEILGAPYYFEEIAHKISKQLSNLVMLSDDAHLVNINIPNSNQEMQWILAYPSSRLYEDRFSVYVPPDSSDRFFFMVAKPRNTIPKPQSDLGVVQEGNIAVSMINVHPAARTSSGDTEAVATLNTES